ncbi:MAG: transcription elongation factor GreB, partial [Propionivibrio sp.]|nr:transcription elongation factor GreB [Propionivibrio sp.]
MSKAFVSETDGDDEDEFGSVPELPQGTRNYITPGGYARIKEELDCLLRTERPQLVEVIHWAASNGDRSENGDYSYG